MRRLYHLVAPTVWQQVGTTYRPESLAAEGFVHCSWAEQVAPVANRFYRDTPELLVLCIDPDRLTSPLREEDVEGARFPHVYGPINRDAVVAVQRLDRDAAGAWVFSPRS